MSEITLYKGRPLESYTKEELIKIVEEVGKMYRNQLEQSASAFRTLDQLHKAARK